MVLKRTSFSREGGLDCLSGWLESYWSDVTTADRHLTNTSLPCSVDESSSCDDHCKCCSSYTSDNLDEPSGNVDMEYIKSTYFHDTREIIQKSLQKWGQDCKYLFCLHLWWDQLSDTLFRTKTYCFNSLHVHVQIQKYFFICSTKGQLFDTFIFYFFMQMNVSQTFISGKFIFYLIIFLFFMKFMSWIGDLIENMYI